MLMVAMTLIAATVSMRFARMGQSGHHDFGWRRWRAFCFM